MRPFPKATPAPPTVVGRGSDVRPRRSLPSSARIGQQRCRRRRVSLGCAAEHTARTRLCPGLSSPGLGWDCTYGATPTAASTRGALQTGRRGARIEPEIHPMFRLWADSSTSYPIDSGATHAAARRLCARLPGSSRAGSGHRCEPPHDERFDNPIARASLKRRASMSLAAFWDATMARTRATS